MAKVLVFGTFDSLHQGHFSFFKQAKKYGDYLVVIVARDKTVNRVKKRFPLNNEKLRLKEVKQYKLVDEARMGYQDNPYKIIKEINPDVICLGYDQKSFTDNLLKKLKEFGLKTKIYRLKPYKPKKFHSSILNQRNRQ